MSLLSENNLITDDILFEHGFRKNEYICDDMRYKVTYFPGHFYKETRIKVSRGKIRSLNFEYPRDFIFSCLCMLDYDPFNQSITLFCEKDSFPNNVLFREKVEDEIDLKAIISYVENHIYDPPHELIIHK